MTLYNSSLVKDKVFCIFDFVRKFIQLNLIISQINKKYVFQSSLKSEIIDIYINFESSIDNS